MPNARKTQSTPSAACRDDVSYHRSLAWAGLELSVNLEGCLMTLRADHVTGAFFIGFGVLVLALSGDLPTGNLSMPGSGFMPKIVAVLTIFFGVVLAVRAGESKIFATLSWNDAKHAGLVVGITAAAVALFEWLGFLATNALLILTLLVVIERRPLLPAAVYSIGVVAITYVLFVYILKTPLQAGPLGF